MKDLMVLVFFYCIQGFLMIISGMLFFDLRLTVQKIILFGISFGLSIFFIRKLYLYFHWPFGTHTLILMVIFCVLCIYLAKIKFIYAVGITLLGFCLVMLGGGLTGVALKLFAVNLETVLNNIWLYIMFGNLSENLLLALFIIFSRVFKFNIKSLGNLNNG